MPRPLNINIPRNAGAVLGFAAAEAAHGIAAMSGGDASVERGDQIHGPVLLLNSELPNVRHRLRPPPGGFEIGRTNESGLVLAGDDERGVLDAVYHLLRELGAEFPLGAPPRFTRKDSAPLTGGSMALLRAVKEIRVEPAFRRRALVSDIMTWHYSDPRRLAQHLEHDREFIPWMARRGLNGFFYIRHANDTRYRIEEIEPLFQERGIELEYGGHIFQQLLPREAFAVNPEYFPVGPDRLRNPRGNLCVSSGGALATLSNGAMDYLRPHPRARLHPWGADVFEGAWCRCERCAAMPPQMQYLAAVNTIARAAAPAEVSYLGYHDTLEPIEGMVPEANVWIEWAPRERCYRHAIDDSACHLNPRYLAALKRYVDVFEGRCHVFEYYGDAILFGGLAVAMPGVIARDLRAYHALGIRSISCLTFGAFSVLAYPVNLIAFAELSRNLKADPSALGAGAAEERHAGHGAEMASAYREVQSASRLVLDYGDVMRPYLAPDRGRAKRAELTQAAQALRRAAEIAAAMAERVDDRVARAEAALWNYGSVTLDGLAEFLAARETGSGSEGEAALATITGALREIRSIQPHLLGTWGALDLERFHQIWIARMRRELERPPLRD